jgi:hypothetical protein
MLHHREHNIVLTNTFKMHSGYGFQKDQAALAKIACERPESDRVKQAPLRSANALVLHGVKHASHQYREHSFGSLGFEHWGTRTWPYLFYGPDTAEIEVPYHAYMTSVERP